MAPEKQNHVKQHRRKSDKLNKLSGQALHAKTLEFFHPVTKKWMSFNSDLPISFKKILKLLENLSS